MSSPASSSPLALTLTVLMLGSALLFGLGPAASADSHATEIGCTTITEPGVYYLTSDLSGHDGTCLTVESADVVIDGQGHTISNIDGRAIAIRELERDNVTIRDMTIAETAGGGIAARWSEDLTIRNVQIENADGIGIAVGPDMRGVTIDSVTVTGSEEGIFMGDVADATISNTELRNNDEWGLRVYEYSRPTVEDTVIAGNQHGIHVELAGGFDARGVEIRDNDIGVAFAEDAPRNSSVHDSVIAGNGAGVTAAFTWDRVALNFTHTYWGAASGPSSAGEGPAADPVTGALANGSGDSIEGVDGTAVVRFDPWLAVPALGDEFAGPPQDLDGDGLYEDVNGDGDVNVGDAQALFAFEDTTIVQENTALFDFNGDDTVNVGDAQALFAQVTA